jgi:hypothetical protein
MLLYLNHQTKEVQYIQDLIHFFLCMMDFLYVKQVSDKQFSIRPTSSNEGELLLFGELLKINIELDYL